VGFHFQDILKPHRWKVRVLFVEVFCVYPASRQWPGDDRSPFPAPPAGERQEAIDATQKRILDYISSHPGVHLRAICRELGLAMGDVQYHIDKLEKGGRIASTRRGFYRFFYPSALFGQKQRDVLSVLALDTPRELLLGIVGKPDSSQEELARVAGVSQPTASWHLKRLVDLGIIEKRQAGKSATYRVVGSPLEIATFIRSYHPTAWERWSSRLADIFIAYSAEEDAGDKK
jgi:DNA-binding MarR family transcriptional regulator